MATILVSPGGGKFMVEFLKASLILLVSILLGALFMYIGLRWNIGVLKALAICCPVMGLLIAGFVLCVDSFNY